MKSIFSWRKLIKQHQTLAFVTDIAMINLVIFNLFLIAFDWHFEFEFFRNFLKAVVPQFYAFYSVKVHPNFLLYDMVFVSIFLLELLVRWGLAIKRKTHYKWFFYPFVHWYDVLGCIPLATFRWLRILRVGSMTIRLHKMGIINLRNTYLFKLGMKYYNVIVEEISDRVVVNVLEGVKEEVQLGSPLTERMISEVIRPHKETLTEWLSHRIRRVTEDNYAVYREDIKTYVEQVVGEAIKDNREVKKMAKIPIVGNQITGLLQQSVGGITFNVVNGMVKDLASDSNNKVIDEVTSIIFEAFLLEEEDQELNKVTKDIIIRSIQMVQDHVNIKRWQLEEEREREAEKASEVLKTSEV